jgi:uncharacterized protein YcnI
MPSLPLPLTLPPRGRNRVFVAVTTVALGTALVVAAPLAAEAHVRVDPDQAAADSYAVLTFRVPTESATASTVRLEVDLPTDHPFGSVSTQPVPGWSATVTTSKLPKAITTQEGATITTAPTKIVWTADKAAAIKPGQFQQFAVSAGPVPETGSIELPAVQTYSDGSVVKWDQATPASGEEPEHPAPTLYIQDAPPVAADASTPAPTVTAAAASSSSAAGSVASDASGSSDGVAIGLGIGGLVLGAAGLGTGIAALRRSRPTAGTVEP